MRTLFLLVLLVLLVATPTVAQEIDHAAHHSDDETEVLSAADQFTEAIIAGDQTVMEGILAEDALILESGGIETREEYFGHHFGADGEFLAAMTRELLDRTVTIHRDAAWISSRSRMQGAFRDRDLDMNSAELLILRRTAEGWRVAAVHWSSRSR